MDTQPTLTLNPVNQRIDAYLYPLKTLRTPVREVIYPVLMSGPIKSIILTFYGRAHPSDLQLGRMIITSHIAL